MTAARCTATSKRTRERCKLPPIRGGTVCRFHGGAIPAVKAAAARRLALADATREVSARLEAAGGPPSVPDVLRELLATAGMAVAWRDQLAGVVERLTEYGAGEDGNLVRADVALFERAMDRAARVLELVARLDLDARVAALDQRTGETLAVVIRRVLERAEMSDDARRDALERITPEELRRVAGGW